MLHPVLGGAAAACARRRLLAASVGLGGFVLLTAGSAAAQSGSVGELHNVGGGPVPLAILSAVSTVDGDVLSGEQPAPAPASTATPAAGAAPAPAKPNPLDQLGTNPLVRFFNYQRIELGQSSAPVDPNAPPAPTNLRPGWTAPPQSTPPMPFTDWPYGGTTALGDNRTASIDSPLMVAIANTGLGKLLGETGIQAYGWIDYGGNISSSKLRAGNAPAAYDYQPNNIQLDQAVLYVERTPDTVQTDHIDWGFRFSAIYGENYRYTTSYGLASYQLLNHNSFYGYDFPMVYGEVYIPQVAQGLMIRVGRYISLPDIEAQLAPNNYMYTHSITYTLDNYTNEGIQTTLALSKNVIVQLGLSVGTETTVWNLGDRKTNFFTTGGLGPDPLYPGTSFRKDPGAQPSGTACLRLQDDSGNNDINFCANGINNGQWGYNNLQWYGFTAYHKFGPHWHISYEFYDEHESGVPNAKNAVAENIYNNGGTPFSPQFIPNNAPYLAQCKTTETLRCTASSIGTVFYLNYSPDPLNNISLRGEYYDDIEGQRTGFATRYTDVGLGWQHWFSPQIEVRPEFTYYTSAEAAFDDGTKKYERVFSGDVILHF